MSDEMSPEILGKYNVRTESPEIQETLTTKEPPPLPLRLVVDNAKPVGESTHGFPVSPIPQKPDMKTEEPIFKRGDWVRYYVNSKVPQMMIAQVEYVDLIKAADGKTGVLQLKTDRGVVFGPQVLERKR